MDTANLKPRELEIIVVVIKAMNADGIQIDFAKVAEYANMSTPKYARDEWGKIRKKLQASSTEVATNGDGEATNGEATTPNGKPKKKAAPRKRKSDGDDAESPSKKKASPRKSKSATPAKAEDEDEESKVKDEPNEAGEAMDAMG